jgi:hypothetical protein
MRAGTSIRFALRVWRDIYQHGVLDLQSTTAAGNFATTAFDDIG